MLPRLPLLNNSLTLKLNGRAGAPQEADLSPGSRADASPQCRATAPRPSSLSGWSRAELQIDREPARASNIRVNAFRILCRGRRSRKMVLVSAKYGNADARDPPDTHRGP